MSAKLFMNEDPKTHIAIFQDFLIRRDGVIYERMNEKLLNKRQFVWENILKERRSI